MYNRFSNEQTAAAFELLVQDEDLYARTCEKVQEEPAKAPAQLRSWVQEHLDAIVKDESTREFVHASLRAVRWEEIRAEFQRQLAH